MPQSVTLSDIERTHLHLVLHRGRANARTLTRVHILLKLDEAWSDPAIVAAFECCLSTVANVRKRYLSGGLEAVLQDKRQLRRRQALSDPQAAHLIAIACSPAPEGHDHWTVRLLAAKAVELGYVVGISLKPCATCSKKPTQTLAARTVVSAHRRQRLRGGDGRGAGSVRRAV